jgi:4-hydroxy 2-oxovalerate aldolase
MKKISFIDATLRDGSHAIKHQLTIENIENYCIEMDSVGMDTIVVGHGNGLGASSLQVGISLLSDYEMLYTARKYLERTKLGTYMIPGFGTIQDDLRPALEVGVDVVKIGCHCTEADTTRQHIEFVRNANKEVYGVLMMYHMASTEKLLEEVQKMESYGAHGVILMDSAGASTMDMVKKTISSLCENVNIKIGFHPHNNLGLAVANAFVAIQEGATIIDGTLKGFGAGAGNCQIEALVAVLEKSGYKTNIDLYKMLDVNEKIMPQISSTTNGLDSLSLVSGMAGVFSAFKIPVLKAAEQFDVDPRDIFVELGRRKAVGGQEDMIIEIAEQLSNPMRNKVDDITYQIGSLL